MSGNTGKMTLEALAARGPRLLLAREKGKLLIFRENQPPFTVAKMPTGHILARSYNLRYLLGIARVQQ